MCAALGILPWPAPQPLHAAPLRGVFAAPATFLASADTAVRAADPDSLTFGTLGGLEPAAGSAAQPGRSRVRLLVSGATLAAGCLIGSQVLLHAADRRYELYRQTSDVTDLQRLYREARSRDRWSNSLLITGEALAAATLVVAWYELGAPASLQLGTRALDGGGAGLELQWHGR